MSNIVITCPMPSTPTKAFLDALPQEPDLIVIDDSNGKLEMPTRKNMYVCDYQEQKRILGEYYDEYTHFHKSSACRNIAHFVAYKRGYDKIIALDYDCVVPANYIKTQSKMYEMNSVPTAESNQKWVNPLNSDQWFTRGFPYSMRANYEPHKMSITENKRVVLNMGMWENVVDINGIDKVIHKPSSSISLEADYVTPKGYIPLCGMNNSFISEIVPAYFFLPNFKIGNWEVSRHDDIWGGYIFQRIAEKKGDIITYGKPVVYHERESNQSNVLHYEHYMHLLSPYFYDLVDESTDSIVVSGYLDMFIEFTEKYSINLEKEKSRIPESYYEGFKYLGRFFNLWTKFFQKL